MSRHERDDGGHRRVLGPIYAILEARGFEVLLVNARHLKNVPGRKSDVLDCEWIVIPLCSCLNMVLKESSERPAGRLTTGPRTKAFEKDLVAYARAAHCVGVTSCTAALHLALEAVGVGPGDENITSPITFASTANVIVQTMETIADIRACPWLTEDPLCR